MFIYIYIYIYIYMHNYICTYMYVYLYIDLLCTRALQEKFGFRQENCKKSKNATKKIEYHDGRF